MLEIAITAHMAVWVLLLVLSGLVFAFSRQTAALFERVAPAGALMVNTQLQVGQPAPVVEAQTLTGRHCTVGRPQSTSARSQLIFFVAPDCPISRSLLPVITRVAGSESGADRAGVQLLIASDGADRQAHEALVHQFKLDHVDYLLSEELGRRYGISKLPYAVLLDATGTVAAFGIVNSREHLESLFQAQELGVASIQDYFELHSEPAEVAHHDVR